MSEINANIVVEPYDLTVTTNNNQINVTPTALNLNVFTNDSSPGGFPGDLQYNANGLLGGIPTANYTAGNLRLGNSSNVKLTGGANAYFLQTDGTGNLTWAPGTANITGNGASAGANNQIQLTNGAGNFKAAPGFSLDTASNLFSAPGNALIAGNVTANYYFGNGAFLTGVDATQISNGNSNIVVYANANIEVSSNGTPNVLSINDNALTFIGNISGNYILGNGAFLTGIDPSQISNANTNVKVYANRITFSENGNANVVTIGSNQQMTVTSMNVNSLANFLGAVGFSSPVSITNNLTVSGNTILSTIRNSVPITVQTPSITFNGYPNTSAPCNITTTGNVTGNIFTGNGSQLTAITGANVTGQVGNALVSGTVYINAQPNITSVGILTSLNVSANITAANITANTGIFTGNGAGLTNIPSGNISGQVANALVAGTVYTNAQPNITSVGNLVNLSLEPNADITLSGIGATISGANLIAGNLIAGTLTTPAQPNITSVGILTNLTVTGNLTAGNGNLGNLVSANFFQGDGTLLTNVSPNVANTNANSNIILYPVLASNTGINQLEIDNVGNILSYNPRSGLLTTRDINAQSISFGTQSISLNPPGDPRISFAANGGFPLTLRSNSVDVNGTLNVFANLNCTVNSNSSINSIRVNASNNITAPQIISNIAIGTPPLVVTSTTLVANLNVANADFASVANKANITNTNSNTITTLYPVLTTGTGNAQLEIDNTFNVLGYEPFSGELTVNKISTTFVNQGSSRINLDNNGVYINAAGTTNAFVISNSTAICQSTKAASAAVNTTISHKIPIVLNGVTYYICLTTSV